MEFLDEEARPRFLFQSRVTSVQSPETESEKLNKPVTLVCVFTALLFSTLSILYIESETLRSLVLWFSLSLLVGPFAPSSLTGGDPRVGQGEPIQPPPSPLPSDHHLDLNQNSQIDESKKRRPKSRKPFDESRPLISANPTVVVPDQKEKKKKVDSVSNVEVLEEMEWTEEDFHMLKKQISRHPVGEPRRWELITEAFKGRHGMESVIKTAKSLGEKKPGSGGDSYSQFLKQRKPLDKRANGEMDEEEEVAAMMGEKQISGNWSSAEDIALLNALKVFPKEVSMRWEKIAAAVPGKSKALCMKRVAELKKDFRSSKASAE